MTYFEAMERLINNQPWSIKISLLSNSGTALIMDFIGVITHGPAKSNVKADYYTALIITKYLMKAENWIVLEENCKWKDK